MQLQRGELAAQLLVDAAWPAGIGVVVVPPTNASPSTPTAPSRSLPWPLPAHRDRTGWSVKKFVTTARRYRTVQIHADQQLLAAEDLLPTDVRDALPQIT
nr:hypothetical protein [Kribbella jejuensis]